MSGKGKKIGFICTFTILFLFFGVLLSMIFTTMDLENGLLVGLGLGALIGMCGGCFAYMGIAHEEWLSSSDKKYEI